MVSRRNLDRTLRSLSRIKRMRLVKILSGNRFFYLDVDKTVERCRARDRVQRKFHR